MDAQTNPTPTVQLSVIIPVYNSADIFPELHHRLVAVLEPAVKSFEIIAVLDGCRDRSVEVIGGVAGKDPRVKMIEFSRNFGHQAAITAGLASGRSTSTWTGTQMHSRARWGRSVSRWKSLGSPEPGAGPSNPPS